MSSYLNSVSIGASVLLNINPLGSYAYVPNKWEYIGMMAGGTGLTPMFQIINYIFFNTEDKTKISFIFGNSTEQDIILKDTLNGLKERYPERFSIYYTLTYPTANWTGGQGHISKEMVQEHMPSPDANYAILLSGTASFLSTIKHYLENLQYKPHRIFRF